MNALSHLYTVSPVGRQLCLTVRIVNLTYRKLSGRIG